MKIRISRQGGKGVEREKVTEITQVESGSPVVPRIHLLRRNTAMEVIEEIEYPLESSWRRFAPRVTRVLEGGIPVYNSTSISCRSF